MTAATLPSLVIRPAIDHVKLNSCLIITPTYNEVRNIERLIDEVLAQGPQFDILIIDDNSPDGTADLVRSIQCTSSRIHLIERSQKLGLGSAYLTGFRFALSRGYTYVCEMDADLSHQPHYLLELLRIAETEADVAIGSRNMSGGGVAGYSWLRRFISVCGSSYARFMLRMPIRDVTTGFKCFRASALRQLKLNQIESTGFAFQVELKYRCHQLGLTMKETPIIFPDRVAGKSKMSWSIFFEAMIRVWRLRSSKATFNDKAEAPINIHPWLDPALGLLAIVLLSVGIALGFETVGVLAVTLIALALIANNGISKHHDILRYGLAVAVASSALSYTLWRISVINWQHPWLSLPLFAAEVFGILHVLGFQYTIWPRRERQSRELVAASKHAIHVLVPTVNEGVEVLRPTIAGILKAKAHFERYSPDSRIDIVLCNDGRVAGYQDWVQVEYWAKDMGIKCITRTVPGGAKAGNIENARQALGATGNCLIAIFDADQVPTVEFFTKTVGYFTDPKVGWVQTGQYYGNVDNAVARWADEQQRLFYEVLCPGKSALNSAFICGTNVILRAEALDEIGGLPQDSVTEDFAASIKLHRRWTSVFVNEHLATGIGPMTLQAYFKQQYRWAVGTLTVGKNNWRELLLPQPQGLTLSQRIQYGLACTHYLSGVRDAIYVLAPLVYLLFGVSAVQGAWFEDFLWHFGPYILLSQLAFWYTAHGRTRLGGIVIGFASFPILIGSALTSLSGRKIEFGVTTKKADGRTDVSVLYPHMTAIALGLIALVVGNSTARDVERTLVTSLWVSYSSFLLLASIWLGVTEPIRKLLRVLGHHRPAGRFWVVLSPVTQLKPALTVLILTAGMSVAIYGLQAVTAQSSESASEGAALPAQFTAHIPHTGITVPLRSLRTAPADFAQQFQQPLGIIRTTQEISDSFDREWADQVASEGTLPWVTLLFTGKHKEPIWASLPAIANGIHDEAVRRWAEDIRSYGKPVYLTIIPHTDRNWSVSSAVTNGGIPQDAKRAWAHVHALFEKTGAHNVVWVWAPADPAHDGNYVPERAQFDAVLVSLLRYPNQAWSEPSQTIAAVEQQHPDTPLVLEAGAAGPNELKSQWLYQVAQAAMESRTVRAILWYQGSPNPAPDTPRAEADLPWVLEADQMSISLWQRISQATVSRPALPVPVTGGSR